MKKTLLAGVSTALLLSSAIVATPKAEASTANINYLSSSVVKKAKTGKLTKDGIKIGNKAYTYTKSSNYKRKSGRVFGKDYPYFHFSDIAFVDFQSKVPSSKRVVTRIVDKDIESKRRITRSEILKKYGKAIKSDTTVNQNGVAKSVVMYKNITFFFAWSQYKNETPVLTEAVIMHNKSKYAQRKWFEYATNEADYNAENMVNYIKSSEWAGL